MTDTSQAADPRPRLRAALDQAQREIDAIGPGELDLPTPCAEYDVRLLLAHLLAVLRKLELVGRGGDMTRVKDPAEDRPGSWSDAIRRARGDLDRVWAADSALAARCTLSWGEMSGREVLQAYTHEFTVHTWDLSRATGRDGGLDPELAEAALDWFTANVPAGDRGAGGQFASPVAVPDDADAYLRLAGFVGRPVWSEPGGAAPLATPGPAAPVP